jgi:hypothetical protein
MIGSLLTSQSVVKGWSFVLASTTLSSTRLVFSVSASIVGEDPLVVSTPRMSNCRKLVDTVPEQSRLELVRFLLGSRLRGSEEEASFSLQTQLKFGVMDSFPSPSVDPAVSTF